jgi:hypothetical protein
MLLNDFLASQEFSTVLYKKVTATFLVETLSEIILSFISLGSNV